MKKILIILSLTLLLLGIAANASAEEGTAIEFEPVFINFFDYKASEWYDTSENRALLSVMFALELSSVDEGFDTSTALVHNPSYVGCLDGLTLVLCFIQPEKTC